MTHTEARAFLKEHVKYRGGEETIVTEQLVRYWWSVLNVAVFYGKLSKPIKVETKQLKGSFGEAEVNTKHKGRINIRLQNKFLSKCLFLTVLLHEMVHAWEHQHHTVMGHGKRFYAWKNRIKRTTGLDLDISHDEDDYRYE